MTKTSSRRSSLPTLIAGVVIGAMAAGAVVPLLASNGEGVVAGGTPEFLTESTVPSQAATGTAPAATNGPASAGQGGAGQGGAGQGGAGQGGAGQGAPAASSQATAPSSSAPMTASDIGVTPKEIHLGVPLLVCGACSAFGIDTADDVRGAAQAAVDAVNEGGGVNGRKIVPHYENYDGLSDAANGGASERAACLNLTERSKVFAVVSWTLLHPECYYAEHQTPLVLVNDYGGFDDPGTFNSSQARLWLVNASGARQLADLSSRVVTSGVIKPGDKFGIIDEDVSHELVQAQLIDRLNRSGHPPAHVSTLHADTATLPSQIATQQAAMRNKGVTKVISLVNQIEMQLWLQGAERSGWRPSYTVTDFPGVANDIAASQYSSSFVGATAFSGVDDQGQERSATFRACNENAERRLQRQLEPGEPQTNVVLLYCDLLSVFATGAKNAGPNLTRRSLASGLAASRSITLASLVGLGHLGGAYGLGPVKWSAQSFVVRKEWRDDCGGERPTCWRTVGPVDRLQA